MQYLPKQDNATGNRVALYSRALFQKLLFHLGEFVQEWPKSILTIGMFILLLCCYWLKDVQIETDLVKLWVERMHIVSYLITRYFNII
jgi:type II secretory pathway component PulF